MIDWIYLKKNPLLLLSSLLSTLWSLLLLLLLFWYVWSKTSTLKTNIVSFWTECCFFKSRFWNDWIDKWYSYDNEKTIWSWVYQVLRSYWATDYVFSSTSFASYIVCYEKLKSTMNDKTFGHEQGRLGTIILSTVIENITKF